MVRISSGMGLANGKAIQRLALAGGGSPSVVDSASMKFTVHSGCRPSSVRKLAKSAGFR
jgi:hypothetical protein